MLTNISGAIGTLLLHHDLDLIVATSITSILNFELLLLLAFSLAWTCQFFFSLRHLLNPIKWDVGFQGLARLLLGEKLQLQLPLIVLCPLSPL